MSTAIGRRAEDHAAKQLQRLGFHILEQNWRTRWCEIDIVASKDRTIYLVEVKFRSSAAFGDGLEYITSKKLKQMHFAAEFWCAKHSWNDDYELAAMAVSGPGFETSELLIVS